MIFQVFLTDDASRDLESLYDYIESHDAPGKADYVLDQIERPFRISLKTRNEEPIQRNCWPSDFASTVRFFQTLPHHIPGHSQKCVSEPPHA